MTVGFKVPKFHTVHIRRENYTHLELQVWCEANCRGAFYIIPSWRAKAGCQFEDDEDATMFALRWA